MALECAEPRAEHGANTAHTHSGLNLGLQPALRHNAIEMAPPVPHNREVLCRVRPAAGVELAFTLPNAFCGDGYHLRPPAAIYNDVSCLSHCCSHCHKPFCHFYPVTLATVGCAEIAESTAGAMLLPTLTGTVCFTQIVTDALKPLLPGAGNIIESFALSSCISVTFWLLHEFARLAPFCRIWLHCSHHVVAVQG
ncbi:MAG: hypothetical protein QGG31_06395, partial [Anaerolineales bacterium]|nr:hypothetical protein [Anaerolineales bacterium]